MAVVLHECLAEKVKGVLGQLGNIEAAGLEEQEKVNEMLCRNVGDDPSERVKHVDGCSEGDFGLDGHHIGAI